MVPERQLLTHVVSLINRRAAAGVITRFVKVKVHRTEPLNEAADAMASAASELDLWILIRRQCTSTARARLLAGIPGFGTT